MVCGEMRSILDSELPHMSFLRPGDRTTAGALSPNYIGHKLAYQDICSWWRPGKQSIS